MANQRRWYTGWLRQRGWANEAPQPGPPPSHAMPASPITARVAPRHRPKGDIERLRRAIPPHPPQDRGEYPCRTWRRP